MKLRDKRRRDGIYYNPAILVSTYTDTEYDENSTGSNLLQATHLVAGGAMCYCRRFFRTAIMTRDVIYRSII